MYKMALQKMYNFFFPSLTTHPNHVKPLISAVRKEFPFHSRPSTSNPPNKQPLPPNLPRAPGVASKGKCTPFKKKVKNASAVHA
jgi:hypothetical protein